MLLCRSMRTGLQFTTGSMDLFQSSTGGCAIDAVVKVCALPVAQSPGGCVGSILAPRLGSCMLRLQVSQGHLFLLADAICFIDKVRAACLLHVPYPGANQLSQACAACAPHPA